MRLARHALLAVLVGAIAAGCGEDEGEGSATPVVAPKAAKPAAVAAKPATEPEKPFVYSPVGKRDPFRSYLADLAAENATKQPDRKVSPTEEYAIEQYRLTAVITGTSQPKAMVEDPRGRGHVLQVGTRLGKNAGRVTQISSRTVVVVEETRTPTGERIRVPITLRLPKEDLDVLVE